MALITQPPNNIVANEDGTATPGYQAMFSDAVVLLQASTLSGTTGQRPTRNMAKRWIGMCYFDTSLGLPVFLKSVSPDVWVNGAGVPV